MHPSTGVVLTKTVTPYLRHTNPTKGLSEFYPERILPMMNQTTTYCNDLLSIFSTIASIKEKLQKGILSLYFYQNDLAHIRTLPCLFEVVLVVLSNLYIIRFEIQTKLFNG